METLVPQHKSSLQIWISLETVLVPKIVLQKFWNYSCLGQLTCLILTMIFKYYCQPAWIWNCIGNISGCIQNVWTEEGRLALNLDGIILSAWVLDWIKWKTREIELSSVFPDCEWNVASHLVLLLACLPYHSGLNSLKSCAKINTFPFKLLISGALS